MKLTLYTYLFIALAFVVLVPDSFCFTEQWRTFYWDADYCQELIRQEGVWQLVSDFFTQFLASRPITACLLAVPFSLLSLLLASLLRPWSKRVIPPVNRFLPAVLPGTIAAVIAITAGYFTLLRPTGESARFKSQMCMVSNQDWQGIIAQSEHRTVANLLELNMLNLALAETSQLQQRMNEQPCRDVNSLFVLEIQSPFVAALLSDIYWSMGEISMSQMYAFEANEKMDNLSPRLLKRLVLTNIAFGHYAVASKYLTWLEKTLFYRQWASHYRSLLNDEAVALDRELRLKRACIPADNCFPSAQSVAYDLEQIMAANPEHSTTGEYLGALKKLYGIK